MNIVLKDTVRLAAERIFPRDPELRMKGLNDLKPKASVLETIRHAVGAVLWGYGEQLAASFNRHAAAAQAVVVVVCFALAPPRAALYALAAVLIALVFRDAFNYRKRFDSEARYYLDSAGDAAAAGVFLIASEALAVFALPSMALPAQVLFRGGLVAMPLIATLQMVLRPKPGQPGPRPPSQRSVVPAKKLYRKTRWLNFLWLVTVYGVVMHSVTDKPHYFPDFLRGLVPVVSWAAWLATQADDLCRRDNLVTLFTAIEAKTLRRMRGRLLVREKDDVNYSTFKIFQAAVFGLIALMLYAAAEPFLFGEPLLQSSWKAAGVVLAFAVVVLSWKHVKIANRSAAQALLREARKEETNA